MSFSYYPPQEPFLGHIPLWRQVLVCLLGLVLLPVLLPVLIAVALVGCRPVKRPLPTYADMGKLEVTNPEEYE